MKYLTVLTLLFVSHSAALGQLDNTATGLEAAVSSSRSPEQPSLDPGRIATSTIGGLGKRQQRGMDYANVEPLARIANRIRSRIELRMNNRIDRYYDRQYTAEEKIRAADARSRSKDRSKGR